MISIQDSKNIYTNCTDSDSDYENKMAHGIYSSFTNISNKSYHFKF